MKDIIIVCEDLFGLEVYSILEQINKWHIGYHLPAPYRVLGYISDAEFPFGDVPSFMNRLGPVQDHRPMGESRYVMGVTVPEHKKQIADSLKTAGCLFETVFAPWTLTPPIEVGEGCVIAAYSVKAGMQIGNFVTVLDSLLAAHMIGDYSTILYFSNITGNVGKETYIGSHAYTHLGKQIGDHCFVADGSIVVKDVKSGNRVSGVPARRMK